VFFDQILNAIYLFAVKAFVGLEPDWAEPKFSFVLISFNLDIRWFIAVSGVAEKR
jgi:hypothetical protein